MKSAWSIAGQLGSDLEETVAVGEGICGYGDYGGDDGVDDGGC
jgi:hypothetical protein